MPKNPDETEADDARAALRASMERAHELVSEAKERIRLQEEPAQEPPLPG